MLIFRSKDHLARWIELGHPDGDTMTPDQQWTLARRWYGGRDRPDWKKRTPEEAQEVLGSVGLTSEFWNLG